MKTKSFTLIELLIVVAIIGILAAIAISNYLNASLKAEIASTYARMKNTHSAIFNYMLDHQTLPPRGYAGNFYLPRAFSSLTTPVNYLGSFNTCEDTLRSYNSLPTELKEMGITKTYFMYDSKSAYQYNPDPITKRKDYDKGIRYLLASTGPDGWSYNLYTLAMFPNKLSPLDMQFVYSTSNGLRSEGDIVSTNVEIYR